MLSNSQVLLICSPIININSYNPVPLEYSKRTMTWCRSIVPLSLQNMKNFFIRVRLFDRLHFFWAKRITSFAGKLPSYALAKSCERSELTTYQVTVMRKFEIEDNIPVCGRAESKMQAKDILCVLRCLPAPGPSRDYSSLQLSRRFWLAFYAYACRNLPQFEVG